MSNKILIKFFMILVTCAVLLVACDDKTTDGATQVQEVISGTGGTSKLFWENLSLAWKKVIANHVDLINENDLPTTLNAAQKEAVSNIERLNYQCDVITPCTVDDKLKTLGPVRYFTKLKSLNFFGNAISSLEVGIFSGLGSLGVLNLGGNEIGSLKMGGFTGLTGLKILQLKENKISKVESGAFTGVENLEQLTLINNRITNIEADTFMKLDRLQRLTLYYQKSKETDTSYYYWTSEQEKNIRAQVKKRPDGATEDSKIIFANPASINTNIENFAVSGTRL